MKTLIVYDTQHDNTEQIARAMGEATDSQVRRVTDVSLEDVEGYDLIIVGSPTHGGLPTEAIHGLLKASLALEGVNVAAFDTRTDVIWNKILPFGYAAPRIAERLEGHGGKLVVPPEGFIVLGMEGPLKEGELERAAA